MAFKTLDALRTTTGTGLNDELGLLSDSDTTWGSTALRNGWLQKAIAKLWPRMGRLTRESFTTTINVVDYALTSLHDVERLEVLNLSVPTVVESTIRTWSQFVDEAADPPTIRLRIPNMQTGRTVRAIGYVPYLIPATGGASCDIPPRLEWIVMAGARVEAYRYKLNQFANFERFANENRQNSLTPADVVELLRQARSDFEAGLRDNGRKLEGARRGQLTL